MKKQTCSDKKFQSIEQLYKQAGIHPSVDNAAIRVLAHIMRLQTPTGRKE